MKRTMTGLVLLACLAWNVPAMATDCVQCHSEVTPNIVQDWEVSRHRDMGVKCDACHGAEHTSRDDVAEAKIPTPGTCSTCHPQRVLEYQKGKHAKAWTALKAMPTPTTPSGTAGVRCSAI